MRPWVSLAVLVLVIVAAPGRSHAQSTSDGKVWAGFTGKVDLTDPIRLDVEHQERFGSANGVEQSLTELSLRFQVLEMLRLGAAYRMSATTYDGANHRVSGDATLSHEFGDLELAYRLRLQSTSRPTDTRTSVRNKVGASYAYSKHLEPFAAFELHYLTTNSEFREARAVFGADVELSKRMSLGAFYMFQSEFNKRVSETNHILGLGLSFSFRKVKNSDKAPAPTEAIALNGY